GVVPPELVRDVRRRSDAGPFGVSALTLSQALDVARRLGATTMVRGGFSHGGGGYVLDLTVYDVAHGRPLGMVTVRDTSVLGLAGAAAARLDAVLGSSRQGPGIAEAETPSLDAYRHYVAALQAQDEGRYVDAADELNASLAADSQFVAALRMKAALAELGGDAAAEKQALAAAARAGTRATPFDRLDLAVRQSLLNGERGRPIELARQLVREYPRDPRAYRTLANALFSHGRFAEQEAVLARALDLDSLGMEAGRGPCVPCVGYGGLAEVRLLRGDVAGAIAASRRWVQLQPEVPGAWAVLGSVLSMAGDFPGAEQAQRRAAALDPMPVAQNTLVRTWLMAGRYAAVDSATRDWERTGSPEARDAVADLRSMLQRERGQFHDAARTLATAPARGAIPLVLANTLSRIGDAAAARRIYEAAGHPTTGTGAERARAYCWAHALEAQDLAEADTTRLRALADSIEAQARLSYYARDWRLASHVRGLLALRAGRYAEAARDLEAARFGVAGWTATNLALARAQLALRRPQDAVRTLREALIGPLDGMGRYVPRSEIAFALAQAYQQ
ncbi:MAG TPA: hypothetical protein VF832_12920, partial [Longimicrobiales bacterium]